jgi:hypothetical protein
LTGFHIRTFRAQNVTFVREMHRQFDYCRDPFLSDWPALGREFDSLHQRNPDLGFCQADLIAMGVTELEKKRDYFAPSA